MTRSKYIIILVVTAILAGVIPNLFPIEQQEKVYRITIIVAIGFVVPILGTIRLKYIGQSWKEYFMGFIPFYGVKYRYKRFTEK